MEQTGEYTAPMTFQIDMVRTNAVPLGYGRVMVGQIVTFETGLAGLLFRAIPDDMNGGAGQPMTQADAERLSTLVDAPSTVLFFKDLAAIDRLIADATDLKTQWVQDMIRQEMEKLPSLDDLADYHEEFAVHISTGDAGDAEVPGFFDHARNLVEHGRPVREFREQGYDHFADWMMERPRG
ncbi:hypothetical protein vBCbaSRXM_28 [Citromicrobium phage vB_CbaS-RXM]|nr:hypothetical protein vBCbaSRXM_28 [Citromicrobium phage vB_CbaS-RXM]